MKKITQSLLKKNTQYIVSQIKQTIQQWGPREPGSAAEKNCIEHMAKELESLTDQQQIDAFICSPKAFEGWIEWTVRLGFLAFIFLFFAPIISIILCFIAILPFIFELLLYKEFCDPFFPKKTSHNLTAIKKPKGKVLRRIFFNGHADSAWEWPLNRKFGGTFHTSITIIAILGMGLLFINSLLINFLSPDYGGGFWQQHIAPQQIFLSDWLIWSLIPFLPFWAAMFFYVDLSTVVPGANDNLSACYVAIAVLKTLKEANIQLENTEIGIIITGSEEAGLRGSKRWAKQYYNKFKNEETAIVVMETLREQEHYTIYKRDLNQLVSCDAQIAQLIQTAAKENNQRVIPFGGVPVGATDAAGFTQGGFRACCLGALSHKIKNYYHTVLDDHNNINPECLEESLNIMLKVVELFDHSKFISKDKNKTL